MKLKIGTLVGLVILSGTLVTLVGTGHRTKGLLGPSAEKGSLVEAPRKPSPRVEEVQRRTQRASQKSVNLTGLPMSFEPNVGQGSPAAKFVARGTGYELSLSPTMATLTLIRAVPSKVPDSKRNIRSLKRRFPEPDKQPRVMASSLGMHVVGANPNASAEAEDPLPGKVNYFIGSDPKRWRSNVSTYKKVRFLDVYPGIDLVYYGNQRKLEYDFVVKPGQDPRRIALRFDGTKRVEPRPGGALSLFIESGELVWQRPVAYQLVNGVHKEVEASYVPSKDGGVRFEVGDYRADLPLIIDPALLYVSYLGGSGDEYNNLNAYHYNLAHTIAVDSTGHTYVSGQTFSANFPSVPSSAPPAGSPYTFVTKISQDGTSIMYSTLIGGPQFCSAHRISVDESNRPAIAGRVVGQGLPTTANAFQPNFGGGVADGFVLQLTSDGSALVYCSYYGGTNEDWIDGIVATGNELYVGGSSHSTGMPCVNGWINPPNGTLGGYDVVLARFDSSGSGAGSLTYATNFGGSEDEVCRAIALTPDHHFVVAGDLLLGAGLSTGGFPLVGGGQAGENGWLGGWESFISHLDPSIPGSNGLLFSTAITGSGEETAWDLATYRDSQDRAFVTVESNSNDLSFAGGIRGQMDAFLYKCDITPPGAFNNCNVILQTPYVEDLPACVAVDPLGYVYTCTSVVSAASPPITSNAIQPTYGGGDYDDYIRVYAPNMADTVYGSFFGGPAFNYSTGMAVDSDRKIYLCGQCQSQGMPITPGAFQPNFGGGNLDYYVAAIVLASSSISTLTPSSVISDSGAFTLRVDGSGFAPGSTVMWNGQPRSTTYQNPTGTPWLEASIPNSDIPISQYVQIKVRDLDGAQSLPATFTVNNPVASISNLNPSNVIEGNGALTLTLTGSEFRPNSVVRWGGSDRPTTYVSPTQLTAQITAADVAWAGSGIMSLRVPVTVFNPSPGGGLSSPRDFQVKFSSHINVANTDVQRGYRFPITILALLSRNDGAFVPAGLPVTITIGNATPVAAVTSAFGIILANFTIPENWEAGHYTITVNYAGNTERAPAVGTGILSVTPFTMSFLQLPLGSNASGIPTGVNGDGEVSGSTRDSIGLDHPALWQPGSGGYALVPVSVPGTFAGSANSINGFGEITGYSQLNSSANTVAFKRMSDGTVQVMDWFPGGFQTAYGYGLSDLGWPAGVARVASGESHAALWQGTVPTDLGTLPGGLYCAIKAINNHGDAVGQGDDGANNHGFFKPFGQGIIDIGTGLGGTSSDARGINDSGVVVGYCENAQGNAVAMTWTQANGMQAVPSPIGVNVVHSYANDISNTGVIVGRLILDTGENHAFLSYNGISYDLATAHDQARQVFPGTLEEAVAIDDSGKYIACIASYGLDRVPVVLQLDAAGWQSGRGIGSVSCAVEQTHAATQVAALAKLVDEANGGFPSIGETIVRLSTSNPSWAAVPVFVTISDGQSQAPFDIQALPGGAGTIVSINAEFPAPIGAAPSIFLGIEASPPQFSVSPGFLDSGARADLLLSDNSYVLVRADTAASPFKLAVTLDGKALDPQPASLKLKVESSADPSNGKVFIFQRVQMWDFAHSAWVDANTTIMTGSDQISLVSAPGPISDFVQSGTLAVRARILYQDYLRKFGSGFKARIDQAYWTFVP